MRLGPIVMLLRLAETTFGNFIAGAAELDIATKNTLTREMAFVIPLEEDCAANAVETSIDQVITERFGVVVAVKCVPYQEDKTGLTAYDRLHDVREELIRTLVGRELSWTESNLYYRGGQLMQINGAWLWYMFRFEFKSRIGVSTGV